MTGHEDPKGEIKFDKDKKAYVKVIEEKKPEEEKKYNKFDLNKDGKIDVKDVKVAVKKFSRKKGN